MQINVKNLKSQSSPTTPHHSFNFVIVHIFYWNIFFVKNMYKYFFIKLKIYIAYLIYMYSGLKSHCYGL